ncbi:insulinase family protein [Candidatus Pacearchaeota archaeon]|nr:insulinase family protein [Candidatus Pacearchaeota archaeon]
MQTEFFKKKLKNGLMVLFEKRNLPVVAVSSSVKWGHAYEAEKIKGISHFLEHLLFKGTKKRSSEEIAVEIEKRGGELNGFTSDEVTSYWKIKMYHDDPKRYSIEKIKELLYEKPFGSSGAGKAEVIKSLNRQQVVELYNSMYTSDSMILSVVGDANFEDVCQLAEKIYPFTKRKVVGYAPVKKNAELIEKRKGIDQAHFVFGFHAPNIQQKERYAYETACAYLFDGMSSRLFQEIREKRGLAYAVKGDIDMGKNYGYVLIRVGTTEGKIKEIKEIILNEIRKLKETEQKDLEEVKEQLIGQRDIGRENSVGVMNSLMTEEIAGDAEEYYKYPERISAVKLGDIKKISELKSFSTFSLIPQSAPIKNTKK